MATRRLVFAASAVALTSAQVIPGCTTNSFTIPSWWLSSFKAEGDAATFHLVNRATNLTTDVSCTGVSASASKCSVTDAEAWYGASGSDAVAVTVANNKAVVTLNQIWKCDDRSHLYFTADGNTTLPLTCAGTSCTTPNPSTLIRASLEAPIYITPEYTPGPPGHANPGCLAAASEPSWSISSVDYRELMGDGLDPADYRTISFLISNDNTGYTASCFLGNAVTGALSCAGAEFQGNTAERYKISTSGTWDAEKRQVSISQNWFCDDVDEAKPVTVSANGTQVLSLKCEDKALEGIPNGNSRACESEGVIAVKGTPATTTPLPPYSLTDPLPQADSCTITSILNPKWTFSNLRVLTGANNVSSIAFNIILAAPRRGFAYPIGIQQDTSTADPNSDEGFYPCVIDEPDPSVSPMWPTFCEVRWIGAEKRLTLRAEWNCSDLDVKHAVHFLGNTDTVVNSNFACEDEDGHSECVTENSGYTWSEEMTDVQWFAAWRPDDPE